MTTSGAPPCSVALCDGYALFEPDLYLNNSSITGLLSDDVQKRQFLRPSKFLFDEKNFSSGTVEFSLVVSMKSLSQEQLQDVYNMNSAWYSLVSFSKAIVGGTSSTKRIILFRRNTFGIGMFRAYVPTKWLLQKYQKGASFNILLCFNF